MSTRVSRSEQQGAEKQFIGVTGASSRQAKDVLKRSNWKVDEAVEYWFTNGMTTDARSGGRVDGGKVQALFAKYKDEGDDTVSIQGVLAMATDLGMEMTDLRVTILLAFINFVKLSSSMVDFNKGLTEMGADTVASLKSKLTGLQGKMGTDPELFKRVYKYAYEGNLEPGQKALKMEIAIMLLPVLMADRWPLTAKFTAFLGTTGQERLSKDSWSTLIAFQKALPNEGALSSWVDDGSWPVLMDEFVEYLNGGGSAAGAAGASGAS